MYINEGNSPDDFLEIALAHLNLDKHLAEKHLAPRWDQYHIPFLTRLTKTDERSNIDRIETDVLFKLIFGEAAARSAVKQAIQYSENRKEAAVSVLPFYRDIQLLLKICQRKCTEFSPEVNRIYLTEKPEYEGLLSELGAFVRDEGKNIAFPEDEVETSPFQQAISATQNQIKPQVGIMTVDFPDTSKDNHSLHFPLNDHQRIIQALTPFVHAQSKEDLIKLISEGATSQKILFTGTAAQLGTYFREVHENILSNTITKQKLTDWIETHFLYWNRKTAGYSLVSKSTMKTHLSEVGRQTVNPIPFE